MTVLTSRIDTNSEDFATNREHMQSQVRDLREQVERVCLGGGGDGRRALATAKEITSMIYQAMEVEKNT